MKETLKNKELAIEILKDVEEKLAMGPEVTFKVPEKTPKTSESSEISASSIYIDVSTYLGEIYDKSGESVEQEIKTKFEEIETYMTVPLRTLIVDTRNKNLTDTSKYYFETNTVNSYKLNHYGWVRGMIEVDKQAYTDINARMQLYLGLWKKMTNGTFDVLIEQKFAEDYKEGWKLYQNKDQHKNLIKSRYLDQILYKIKFDPEFINNEMLNPNMKGYINHIYPKFTA
jgi:hypothetical protein